MIHITRSYQLLASQQACWHELLPIPVKQTIMVIATYLL